MSEIPWGKKFINPYGDDSYIEIGLSTGALTRVIFNVVNRYGDQSIMQITKEQAEDVIEHIKKICEGGMDE